MVVVVLFSDKIAVISIGHNYSIIIEMLHRHSLRRGEGVE